MHQQRYTGIHSGWVSVKAYKDVHGRARYKAETLVAGSSIAAPTTYEASVQKTGTATVASANVTVTGSGTQFSTQFTVGDRIRIGSTTPVYGTVAAIANNTSLTLATGASAAKTANTVFKMVSNTAVATDGDTNQFFYGT